MSIFVTWIGEGAEPHGLIGEAIRVLGREYARPAARVSLDGRPPDTYDVARRQHASRGVLTWLAAQVVEIDGPAEAGHHDGHAADPVVASGFSRTNEPVVASGFSRTNDPVVASGFSRTNDPVVASGPSTGSGPSRVSSRDGFSRTRLLGVTDVDLFMPVLTFVFGEAQLGQCAAVVSIARLREAAVPSLVIDRLTKEAVHEIGHTFGLVHCASPACVMARSPGLAAVDRKTDRLCADCRVRYQALREQPYVAAHTPHFDR